MLQALLKVAVFAALVRFLNLRWRSLLAVAFGIAVALLAHAEYLSYVELTDDTTYLFKSYWYKWAVIMLVVLLYTLTVELRLRKPKMDTEEEFFPTPEKLTDNNQDDGFDFIRQKERLMTRGERLLNEPKKINE